MIENSAFWSAVLKLKLQALIAASNNRHKFPAGKGPSRGLFLGMKKPNGLGWAKSLKNMVGTE